MDLNYNEDVEMVSGHQESGDVTIEFKDVPFTG